MGFIIERRGYLGRNAGERGRSGGGFRRLVGIMDYGSGGFLSVCGKLEVAYDGMEDSSVSFLVANI